MKHDHGTGIECAACNGEDPQELARTFIEKSGFGIFGIFDAKPMFAYTAGLQELQHPEFLVFGLPLKVGASLLHYVYNRVKAGRSWVDGEIDTSWTVGGLPFAVRKADNVMVRQYVVQVDVYYERPVPVFQLVWSDRQGKLPWEKGWDTAFDKFQPVLYGALPAIVEIPPVA